jgi:TnpA family transposase
MTAIERTAYPRFRSSLTHEELETYYTLTESEIGFVQTKASGETQQLTLALFLKAFQKLGYLPRLTDVPEQIRQYIAQQLQTVPASKTKNAAKASRKRYRRAIYDHLGIKPYGDGGPEAVQIIVQRSAQTMSDPADLINVAVEELVRQRFALPAYSTLDELVNHIRHQVHLQLFRQVTSRLGEEETEVLGNLLKKADGATRYPFTRLKNLPKKATLREVRRWEKHLTWQEKIMDPAPFLVDLTSTKVEQFAAEAYRLEAGDILDIEIEGKRNTLLLCLLHQMQVRTRDQLAEMYLKRIRNLHNSAKKRLREIREQQQALSETMINAFSNIVHHAGKTEKAGEEEKDAILGRHVRRVLNANGGREQLEKECAMLQAYHNNNYLPLLLPYYRRHRGLPFRLTRQLKIRSTSRKRTLLQALDFIQEHYRKHGTHLPPDISLSFASARWQTFIREKVDGQVLFHRHYLEACIFSYVADGLRSGDLYITGSDTYADYRTLLLSWPECQAILDDYCRAVELPNTAEGFVATLRERLTSLSQKIDTDQTEESDLHFDAEGKPHLRRLPGTATPDGAKALAEILRSKMPERHLLDVLHNVHYWIPYTRHFGPPSGSDPKLRDPVARYLITIFGYGCNLGPAQTARHTRSLATARVIGRLNAQHVTTDHLDAGIRDIINEYARFRLPFLWGSGEAAIADGTHYELYENNLLGERHIRYGGYGGIAYHHISDTYIALFSHFIACGVWEAVYILDGLLENNSVLQPDTVHADTQGQSEIVFGLAHMLGTKLMPRMRNWNKVSMYRPDKTTKYRHIDAWFTRVVNWALIEEHWEELMQVVLSIHKGKILPSWLLQKLTTDSPKNSLHLAFRELGRVIRTLFLLEYVSSPALRVQIRAATTKIEAYNYFSQWITFGGDGIFKSRDPIEYEKQVKYKDLIANAIMLQNVVDMTDALHDMAREGHPVTPDVVATFSPYLREHIKRFGEYIIDTEALPPPLQPDKPFLTPEMG